MNQPTVTWTNNRVALANDLIFGLCVFAEFDDGVAEWRPVDSLDLETVKEIHRLVDYNSSCPYLDKLNEILAQKAKA